MADTTIPNSSGLPLGGLIRVNGVDIFHRIEGVGDPLIMLHGGLGNSDCWENQIPALVQQFSLFLIDTRGHGRSPYVGQPLSYELMAEDVVCLMDALGIRAASLLGWSDGGITGLHAASRYPDRIVQLIAFGASYSLSGIRPNADDDPKFTAYTQSAAEDYRKLSPTPDRWQDFTAAMQVMWSKEPNLTAADLAQIKADTLVIGGEHDEVVFADQFHELADKIANSRLVLIPEAGHFAHWEHPELFNQLLIEFLL